MRGLGHLLFVAAWISACGARSELFVPDPEPPGPVCAIFSASSNLAPLDVFMLLDASGSMTGQTGNGNSKWAVMRSALSAFFADPESAGISVSLGYFPIIDESVPDLCFAPDACGAPGACWPVKVCGTSQAVCLNQQDCELLGLGDQPCVPLGVCSASQALCVPDVGVDCAPGGGSCDAVGFCDNKNTCESSAYQLPPPALLPLASSTLLAGFDAQGEPLGGTPTLPALSGVVDLAADWLEAHTDREVIVVLATDGSPSACDPVLLEGDVDAAIENLATAAAGGLARGVRTFVIGVFAPHEASVADARLGAIASAGGSGEAFIVTTSSEATAAFVAALNEVRLSAQACQLTFAIDHTFSTDDVWVKITDDDQPVWVARVTTCGPAGGFYFDPPPEPGATTVKAVLCPSTCTLLGASPGRRAEIHSACN